MSEIRDRVREKIVDEFRAVGYEIRSIQVVADQILYIPEIAIVDREAELPQNPYRDRKEYSDLTGCSYQVTGVVPYNQAQQDMLKAGWVKEVKE